MHTSANISIAAPIITRTAELLTILLAYPESFPKPAAISNIPEIAAPAFPRLPHFISPNFAHTFANISIAAPIKISDSADLINFSGFISFINSANPANTANKPPIPETPLAISFQLSADKSLHTEAIILRAAAIRTIRMAPFEMFFSPIDMSLAAPTSSARSTPTPATPLAKPSRSKSDSFFAADARINTAAAMPIMRTVIFPVPLIFIASLSKVFITPINSAKSTVIAPRAEPSLSGSIPESTHRAAASIPIDMAIDFMVFAFKFCCHAVKESPTVLRTSFIALTKLFPLPAKSLKPLIQLLSLSKIAVTIPPFARSNNDFMSPFRKAFPKALPIADMTLTIARPTFLMLVHIIFRTLRKVSNPGASNLPLI